MDQQVTGQQQLRLPSGDRYTGQVVDGQALGRGILTYPNGTRFQGEFKNNKFIA